jgi:hypothetical protein
MVHLTFFVSSSWLSPLFVRILGTRVLAFRSPVFLGFLLSAAGGCAQGVKPQTEIPARPVVQPAAPLTATVVVTDRTASLVGSTEVDDVGGLAMFHRLDRVFGGLKRLRGAEGDGDVVGKNASDDNRAIVDARPGATSLAVFSAVQTCAYAGFRHVAVRSSDGPFVEGEVLVLDEAAHHVNARPVSTRLLARLRADGVDVAWSASLPCGQVPVDGQTTLSELTQWIDGVCPAREACFDQALLWVDSGVAVGKVMQALASLQRRAEKPLFYEVLVAPHPDAPRQRCDDKK